MVKKFSVCLLMLVFASMLAASCKQKRKVDSGTEDDKPTKQKYASKGDEGEIKGLINFDGTPPERKKIDMGQDANCAKAGGSTLSDEAVVENGKLQNVFVYVKGGPSDRYTFDIPSEPVVLDQIGCRYHPRVLGLMANQTLRVLNSDQTTHNVHPSPKNNAEWNQVQSANGPPIEKKFSKPETLIQVKCNQHPWMMAHVGVLAHPFYNVSAADGTYSIKGLPPGEYTVVAYHEVLGEKSQKVTVGAKGTVTQDFSFSPKAAFVPTSLQIEPALVLP
jgi:hypothetical protein